MPGLARTVAAALLAALAGTALAPAADARFRPHRHRHAPRRHHATSVRPPARPAPASFALVPLLGTPSTPAPATAPVAPPAGGPTAPVTTVQALGATVNETPLYTMLLSRLSVRAGTVTVQLRNAGQDPHDLVVARADGTGDPVVFPVTAPGRTTTQTISLAPGSYRLYCALMAPASHDLLGMHAGLTVTG